MTSPSKATRTVTVTNREGLHLRAASLIAKSAARFSAEVSLAKGGHRVMATDVLQMLSLVAQAGEQLQVEASGPDAVLAVEALAELFHNQFEEEDPQRRHEASGCDRCRADVAPGDNLPAS